jgi:hypothetical protein
MFVDAAAARGLDDDIDAMLRDEQQEPFDSHPPTRERIAALGHLTTHVQQAAVGPALDLLDDVPELELQSLALVARNDPRVLHPIEWKDTPTQLWIPMWNTRRRQCETWLRGKTVADLPRMTADLTAIGLAMQPSDSSDAKDLAGGSFASAFTLALIENGWNIDTVPGLPHRLTRGSEVIEPFHELECLFDGAIDVADWIDRARELGIDSLALWPATLDASESNR